MAKIRLVKLISGDLAVGLDDEENKGLKDVAALQFMPTETGGMSMALLPFGFPFEQDIKGFIANDKVLYEIDNVPEDLQNKYTEATSNIKLISGSNPNGNIIL